MNEKLYPLVLFICIMLIGLILAFADYIDSYIPITALKAHHECQLKPLFSASNRLLCESNSLA